ncbi:MAG: GAF domain-containing protein [Ardenticatenaceae bacterium]|nr:GAF domain-containing protein [Anaerolineales bacterium]MCB8923094.1 GAF domain-containing protein [Ardenticatenaceae bacterium]MCB8990039.1 GAF domain-containing protein [Ardenticatenaceae bacterium]
MRVNLSLGQRLSLGFLFLSLIVVTTSGLGLWFTNAVSNTNDTVAANTQLLDSASALERAWSNSSATIDRMLLTRQTGGFIQQDLTAQIASFDQELANLEAVIIQSEVGLLDQNPTLMTELNDLGKNLIELSAQLVLTAEDKQWAQAQVLRHTELTSQQRRFDTQLEALRVASQELANETLAAQLKLQSNLRLNWIIATVLAVIGGGLVAYFTWRSITEPVAELIEQTGRVAGSDFQPIEPLNRRDELGQLSRAFADMTALLHETYVELEQRVADRTRALRLSTEVSRSLSTILNQTQLVTEVVNQVRSAFDYYHTHIYLLNEEEQKLEMAGGTGEAGMALLAANHSLQLDQGLVGRAATTKTTVLIPDVSQEPGWLPNPLLPETQAETAVPIVYGDTLIGVIDVQHNVVNGLSEEDVRLLESIASQVAIALRNARLFEQAHHQAERQTKINEIGRRIQNATDIEAVLQVAARELGRALGTQRTSIELSRKTVVGNGRTEGRQ